MCDNFIDLGVKKIRLTGGEPLVRKNIIELIKNLNSKKNKSSLKEITLTTNGSLLGNYARSLKKNGINRINVSLDTINKSKYKKITRFGNLTKVISSINEAIKEGLIIKDWCKDQISSGIDSHKDEIKKRLNENVKEALLA